MKADPAAPLNGAFRKSQEFSRGRRKACKSGTFSAH
jgi:hypothetical protein